MIDMMILACAAVVAITDRTRIAVVAAVIIAGITGGAAVTAGHGSGLSPILSFAVAGMTALIAPLGILYFVRVHPVAGDLRPSVGVGMRVAIVAADLFIARGTIGLASFRTEPELLPDAFLLLCALTALMVHRNLLGQIVGLLVLGSAVEYAGDVLLPTLPGIVRTAFAFDAVIVTFIALLLVHAFRTHYPLLDVSSLRRLRG